MSNAPYDPTMVSDPTRSHHQGNPESEKAWQQGNKENWVELTYLAILTAGLAGCTPEQVAEYWTEMLGREVTVLTIRPRFTTLLKEGRIVRTNQTRESLLGSSSRVCVAKIYGPTEYEKPDTREPEPDQETLFQKWAGDTVPTGPEKPVIGAPVPSPLDAKDLEPWVDEPGSGG